MLSPLKKRLGAFTAIAVTAALVPALVASPASAAASATTQVKADTTLLEACPASASIASAGFTDTTSTDVDCIKYYGVTTGVTATTYEPAGTVTRETMALFLSRLATAMGVTLGDGSDQGFTDLPTSAASVTAINQIKQLGVTVGTTATTFSPDDNVTREQMAMFIERLLGNTAPGPNGNSDDTTTTNISGNATTYNYADIDTGVTYEGHNAIAELYHLGVTDDLSGATAYRPSADITRAEMATFMTNAMGHSNARPAGITLQATKNAAVGAMATINVHELHISDRAAAGSTGTTGTVVDVFAYKTSTNVDNAAFGAATTCKDSVLVTMGSVACYMEASDWVTNSTGNIEIQLSAAASTAQVAEAETVQYWAWTAAAGTSYLNGTTTGGSTTTLSSSYGGDHVFMSTSHDSATETNEDYGPATSDCMDGKMGSDITITLQLKRTTGTSAALNVADAGVSIGVNSATGTHGGSNVATDIQNSIVVTDASGTATYTASKAEPTALDDNDTATFQMLTFTNSAVANTAAGKTTIGMFTKGAAGADSTDDAICIHWQDTARDDASVVTSVANGYVTATTVGAGATNTVTATNYDQYGVGVSGASLGMTSAVDGATASTYSVTMTTNSSGTASWGVTRDVATSTREIFRVNDDDDNNASATAYYVVAPGTTALDAGEATGSIPTNYITESAYTYAVAATNGEPEAAWVVFDAANDKMVADLHVDDVAHTYVVYTYDSNDQFHGASGAAQTMAAWEYSWSLISKNAAGVLTAADDWGSGGYAKVASSSYVSQWKWAG
jgi:hypothetical protein